MKKREQIHLTSEEAKRYAVILRSCAEHKRSDGSCRFLSEMTKEEQEALIIGARCDNEILQNAAVKIAFDGLHRAISRNLLKASGLDPDVLMSDCMLAVWEGLCDYSPDHGAQLHTYLFSKFSMIIKNSMTALSAEKNNMGKNEVRHIKAYDKAVMEMNARGISDPTPAEVAAYMKERGSKRAALSEDRINYILAMRDRRFETINKDDSDRVDLSGEGDPTCTMAVSMASNTDLKAQIREAAAGLPEDARDLASFLYGRFLEDNGISGSTYTLRKCIKEYQKMHPDVDSARIRLILKSIRDAFQPLVERTAVFAA